MMMSKKSALKIETANRPEVVTELIKLFKAEFEPNEHWDVTHSGGVDDDTMTAIYHLRGIEESPEAIALLADGHFLAGAIAESRSSIGHTFSWRHVVDEAVAATEV
jgi:hypothetical protein